MDSPMVRVTRDSITNLMVLLGEEDDEKLKLDMLEGETPLYDLVTTLLDGIEDDEGQIVALNEQVEARVLRRERAELRIQQRKNLIQSLLETAGLSKLPLPQATVFTSTIKPGWKVADADQLPEGTFTTETVVKRKPDRDAIAALVDAGKAPAGVQLTNGGTRLNIRRK